MVTRAIGLYGPPPLPTAFPALETLARLEHLTVSNDTAAALEGQIMVKWQRENCEQ